ncbi:hypothetical protein B0J18DRAFT_306034 [Chaetomium sp. MPI-SDFR-AT-0129]|nr:hypothetical protein B0J18DRAFT_306034 [Chaetomium sp. MPI-SDFR-AT-0129]
MMITTDFFLEQPQLKGAAISELGTGWQLYVPTVSTGSKQVSTNSNHVPKDTTTVDRPGCALSAYFALHDSIFGPSIFIFLTQRRKSQDGNKDNQTRSKKKKRWINHGGLGGGLAEMDGSQGYKQQQMGTTLHSAGLGCTIFGANFGMGDTIPPAYLGFCFFLLYFIFIFSFSSRLSERRMREAMFPKPLFTAVFDGLSVRPVCLLFFFFWSSRVTNTIPYSSISGRKWRFGEGMHAKRNGRSGYRRERVYLGYYSFSFFFF